MDIQKLEPIAFEKALSARKQALTDPKYRDRAIMRLRRSDNFWTIAAYGTLVFASLAGIACVVFKLIAQKEVYLSTAYLTLNALSQNFGIATSVSIVSSTVASFPMLYAERRLRAEMSEAKLALPSYVASYLESRKPELEDLLRRVRGFNDALGARQAAAASLSGMGSDDYRPDDTASWANRRDALQKESEEFLDALDETFELDAVRLAEAAKRKPLVDRIEELKKLEKNLTVLHQDGYQEGTDEATFILAQSLRHSIEREIAERSLPPRMLPPAPKTKRKLLRAAAK